MIFVAGGECHLFSSANLGRFLIHLYNVSVCHSLKAIYVVITRNHSLRSVAAASKFSCFLLPLCAFSLVKQKGQPAESSHSVLNESPRCRANRCGPVSCLFSFVNMNDQNLLLVFDLINLFSAKTAFVFAQERKNLPASTAFLRAR